MPAIPNTIGVSGPFAPLDDADTYATLLEIYKQGGYRTVADITARNAITTARRKAGMLVYVVSDDTTYRLGAGLLDADWAVAKFGSLSFATIAALRATIPFEGATATVTGYYAAGDGGGGLFYYSAASAVTDDNGGYIKPTSYNGRWIRITGGTINPRQWGCKGDFLTGGFGGSASGTDDTTAMQAMFDYAKNYGVQKIVGWTGNYKITNSIVLTVEFATPVDFGLSSGVSNIPMNIYMDTTAKPLFDLTRPNGNSFQNISCYWRPLSGWNVAYNNMSPQTDPLSSMFYVRGWGKNMSIKNCVANHCACGITSVAIGAGSGTDQAAMFDNSIEDCNFIFGYRGINLAGFDSGSRIARMRLQTSPGNANGEPGDPPSYHAENAIYIGAAGGPGSVNTEVQNLNIEWSSFTGPMFYLIGSQIKFSGLHVEGINVPYNATYGSVRSLIYQSGGHLLIENSRIQDIHVGWGVLRTFYLFEFFGSPNTFFKMYNTEFDAFNANADDNVGGQTGGYYRLHRFSTNGGGAMKMQVDNLNDTSIRWESDSPSWYGHDDRLLPPAKRFESHTSFADGINPWHIYYSGTPTVVSLINDASATGVLRMNSGGNDTNGTLAILPYAAVYRTKGVHRMLFRFKLSAMATGSADEYVVRIGFFTDQTAAIGTSPVDGMFFETQWSAASQNDNRFDLVCKKNAGSTVRDQWIQANETDSDLDTADLDTEADQWYQGELVINSDGAQVRLFSNPWKSATWANIATAAALPDSTTPLYPQILISKRGAGSNVTLDVDYASVTSAQNGIF